MRILRWCVGFLLIGEVICNTQSTNSCYEDTVAVQVKIETGDQLFAGTDSHVSLVLRSDNGIICQVFDLNNIGNDRERNSIDEYTVCCSKQFLDGENELSMVAFSQLTRSGRFVSFFSDNWFIERIEVRANEKLLFDYRFHAWTAPSRKLIFGVTKVNNTNYIHF